MLNAHHALYHTPVCRAVQDNAWDEAMAPHTCSHHAENSETARHTIHQKEKRMRDVTMLATGLGFPEGPAGAAALTPHGSAPQ